MARFLLGACVVLVLAASAAAIKPGDVVNGYEFHHLISDPVHIDRAAEMHGEGSFEHRQAKAHHKYAITLLQMSSRTRLKRLWDIAGGSKKGSYQMMKLLGSGTFGNVWLASKGGDTFAIKAYNTKHYKTFASSEKEADQEYNLSREVHRSSGDEELDKARKYIVKCLGRFTHTNDAYEQEYYTVWPLMSGTFDGFVGGNKASEEDFNRAYATACFAMAFFQKRGLTHTDLKPENLFYMSKPGEKDSLDYLVIGDLGLVADASEKNVCGTQGSLLFMPPEGASRDGKDWGARDYTGYLGCDRAVDSTTDGVYKFDAWELGISVFLPIFPSLPSDMFSSSQLTSTWFCTADTTIPNIYWKNKRTSLSPWGHITLPTHASSTQDWFVAMKNMLHCNLKERWSAKQCHNSMKKYLPTEKTPVDFSKIARIAPAGPSTKSYSESYDDKSYKWNYDTMEQLHRSVNLAVALGRYADELDDSLYPEDVAKRGPGALTQNCENIKELFDALVADTSKFAEGGLPRKNIEKTTKDIDDFLNISFSPQQVKTWLNTDCSLHALKSHVPDKDEFVQNCKDHYVAAVLNRYNHFNRRLQPPTTTPYKDQEASIFGISLHGRKVKELIDQDIAAGTNLESVSERSDRLCGVCVTAVATWVSTGRGADFLKSLSCTEAEAGARGRGPNRYGIAGAPMSVEEFWGQPQSYRYSWGAMRLNDYKFVKAKLGPFNAEANEMCMKVRGAFTGKSSSIDASAQALYSRLAHEQQTAFVYNFCTKHKFCPE